MANKLFVRGKMDYLLLTSIIVLLVIGVIMVYSSSYYFAGYEGESPNSLFRKEAIFAVLGLVVMFMVSKINYKWFRNWAVWINIITVFAYGLLITPLGFKYQGGVRWVFINGMTFMPSELGKYAGIIAIAYLLTRNKREQKGADYWFLFFCPFIYLIATMLQPDLSTSVVMAGAYLATLLFGGLELFLVFIVAGIGSVAVALSILFSSFRMERMRVYLNPFIDPLKKGFQPIQSMMAIASGGFRGLGLGDGRQKMLYLPLAYNDYIFSIYAEELGFIGCIVLLAVLCVAVFRGLKIAANSPDKFSTLVAGGIISQFAIQCIMHMFVATSLFPSTGIPFPIISYGGTSLLATLGSFGILLGISRFESHKIAKAYDKVENKNYHSLDRRTK